MRLEGKTALVTGGGSGIGEAITERLVEEGARVCIAGRRANMLEQVACSLPQGAVLACAGDVSNDEDVARIVAQTVEFGGGLDILVNNAATNFFVSVADLEHAEWRRVMEVNLSGTFMFMGQAIPHLIERGGGSIINISSVAGLRAMPRSPAYAASKAGMIGLTQQAALDYGADKIRCNVICPGPVLTSLMEEGLGKQSQALGYEPEAYYQMVTDPVPLKRFGTPAEIAGVCAFLASDDSSFMTGAVLVVDGGISTVDTLGYVQK